MVEAGLRVVKSQPMGETFFFFFPSDKILLKPGVGEWRERFVPSDCSQGQCTLGGKWKLTNTAPKLRRGREGRKSCEIRSPLQGEGCPCPALHLQWFFLYSIISAQIPHKSPEPLCSFTCTVSVIRVLIHVNLCGNYRVRQYFLVYCFFPM